MAKEEKLTGKPAQEIDDQLQPIGTEQAKDEDDVMTNMEKLLNPSPPPMTHSKVRTKG